MPAATIAVALAVLGPPAAGALAQLPASEVPLPSTTPVEEATQEPLPAPVEKAVQESPAGPAYQGVRDTLEGALGGGSGGGPGGGGDGGGGGGPAQAGPASSDASSPPGGAPRGGRTRPDRGPTGREGSTRRGGPAGDSRRPSARRARTGDAEGSERVARGGPDAREADRRSGESPNQGGGVGQAIRDIVEVIPGPVLLALVLLAALALALNLRSGIERRRAGMLENEREELRRDVGALQNVLLSPVPERLGGLAASVAYRPAEGPAAGGDFYDAFELPDGRVAVIVGDVSGHGREALVKTASVRHSLGAYLRAGHSPRAALATAGALSEGDDSDFTTVVLAVHDRSTGTLTYATAGHPPPIFHGPAGHEPVTAAASPPLGSGMPTGLRQSEVTLPAGSVVCLFTDGLLEARVGGDLLGRERLTAMVAELGPDDAANALVRAVVREVDDTPDDMAACVLRAVEGPERASRRVEELELGTGFNELTRAGRFLEACGLRGDALASALADAGDALTAFGSALIQVTLGAGEPGVAVSPLVRSSAKTAAPPLAPAA